MKKSIGIFVMVVFVLAMSGCETSGLSMREGGRNTFSSVLYTLMGDKDVEANSKDSLSFPITLAVAQVGEISPPINVMNHLRDDIHIHKVIGLPADFKDGGSYQHDNTSVQDFANKVNKMKNLSKNFGADYLFVYGGTIDSSVQTSWTSFFDITIIGSFIIPSQKVHLEGSASGVLFDVHSGETVVLVNTKKIRNVSSASYLLDSKTREAQIQMRDEMEKQLVINFTDELNKI